MFKNIRSFDSDYNGWFLDFFTNKRRNFIMKHKLWKNCLFFLQPRYQSIIERHYWRNFLLSLFFWFVLLPHIFIDQSTHDDKMRRANASSTLHPSTNCALLEGNNVTWSSSHSLGNVSQIQIAALVVWYRKKENHCKFPYNEKLRNYSWRILSVYPQYPTWPGARPYKHSTQALYSESR